MAARNERRRSSRVPVKVRAAVKKPSSEKEITGEVRDMSHAGVFFYCTSELEVGSPLEMVMIVPPEITGNTSRWVCCQGRAVRLEPGEKGHYGIAAEIDKMAYLPELGSPDPDAESH